MKKGLSLILVLVTVCLTVAGCVSDDPIQDQWTHSIYPDSNGSYTIGGNGNPYSAGYFTNLYATTLYLAGTIVNGSVTATTGNFTNINASNMATLGNVSVPDGGCVYIWDADNSDYFSLCHDGGVGIIWNPTGDVYVRGDDNVVADLTGDSTGMYEFQVENSGNAEVASIDTAGNIDALGNISNLNASITTSGNLLFIDDRGYNNSLATMASNLAEMASDTLLDASRSTLTCSGGVLTYTLIALNGHGIWNFGGVFYPLGVASASVDLWAGNDSIPQVNYIHFKLVAGVPTLVTTKTVPAYDHISVATFLVGNVSGTTYTIYSYNREREETESFINRVITRIAESGTLYDSGFVPTINSTSLSISSGDFFNGLFQMYTDIAVNSSSFYYIKQVGGVDTFFKGTTLAELNYYSDGTAFSNHDFANVVWGIVPTTTTAAGVNATVPKLYAVLPTHSGVHYSQLVNARQDIYEQTNYYPSNEDIRTVFVPICRTILSEDDNTHFQTFDTGLYLKDLRGKITSGGGAATSTDVSGLVPYDGAVQDLNYGNMSLRLDGSIAPASMSNSSAVNNSIYFSTDNNKLVYKDSSGVVNELY
jgi:hypothetical protein